MVSVCVEIKIWIEHEGEAKGFENLEWKLSTCSSKEMAHMSVNETHVYRCCLKHGYYNLECSNNNGPYGWGRSHEKRYVQY